MRLWRKPSNRDLEGTDSSQGYWRLSAARVNPDDLRDLDAHLRSRAIEVHWTGVTPTAEQTEVATVEELLKLDAYRRAWFFVYAGEPVPDDQYGNRVEELIVRVRPYSVLVTTGSSNGMGGAYWVPTASEVAQMIYRTWTPRLGGDVMLRASKPFVALAPLVLAGLAWVIAPELWALNTLATVFAVLLSREGFRRVEQRAAQLPTFSTALVRIDPLSRAEQAGNRIESRQKWVFASLGVVTTVITGVIVAAIRFYYFES